MTERKVWICQCLCPDRHCIMAAANEADSEVEAKEIRTKLRRQVGELLQSGAINPHCAICDAKRATWKYELRRTVFATMDEALPQLWKVEAENVRANAMFGDLHKVRAN